MQFSHTGIIQFSHDAGHIHKEVKANTHYGHQFTFLLAIYNIMTIKMLKLILFTQLKIQVWPSFDLGMSNGYPDCKNSSIFAHSQVNISTVGKQTPCKISFAYTTVTSQGILTFWSKPKFGKFVAPFGQLVCEIIYISYHMQHTFLVV